MFSEEIAELRAEFDRWDRELKKITRDIAWNRVIDSAIHMCRVLAKAEAAEAAKFNPIGPLNPGVRSEVMAVGNGPPTAAARFFLSATEIRQSRSRKQF